VELREWLEVYQAVSVTAANKERTYWCLGATCLIANVLLLLLGTVLGIAVFEETHNVYLRWLTTVLAVFGVLVSAYWLAIRHRMSREVAHWHGLLRQLEGEFAGAEFHRSALRLLMGQPVRAPTITPHFNEWYPEITRLGWFSRKMACLTASLLPTAFLVAWIVLGVMPWVVP